MDAPKGVESHRSTTITPLTVNPLVLSLPVVETYDSQLTLDNIQSEPTKDTYGCPAPNLNVEYKGLS